MLASDERSCAGNACDVHVGVRLIDQQLAPRTCGCLGLTSSAGWLRQQGARLVGARRLVRGCAK
eukprot:9884649-Alexandrium_andersonii.AAC.1